MDNDFKLTIKDTDAGRVINFLNNSNEFVEVVFAIDGKEVKFGREYRPEEKGYGYPPKLEKEVKRMKNNSPLPFRLLRGGEVKAYVFRGAGAYHDRDIDKPTWIRHRLVSSVKFRRKDVQPCEVLSVRY